MPDKKKGRAVMGLPLLVLSLYSKWVEGYYQKRFKDQKCAVHCAKTGKMKLLKKEASKHTKVFNRAYRKIKEGFSLIPQNEGKKYLRHLQNIHFKLDSVRYHRDNYIKIQEHYVKEIKNLLEDFQNLSEFDYEVPRLRYEFEAFLFQSKSCLELLIKFIGMFFRQYPTKIKTLRNVLENNMDKRLAGQVLALLNDTLNWFQDFEAPDQIDKSMRDYIAHYGQLKLSTLRIMKVNGGYKIQPIQYRGESVDQIIRRQYNTLRWFVELTLNQIFLFYEKKAQF